MKTKGKTMSKEKVKIEYPRHWWFSCNVFTCYLETDEYDKIGINSTGVASHFVGVKAKRFAKRIQRKFGGVAIDEYLKGGQLL